jgi:uncharacterized membrane protein
MLRTPSLSRIQLIVILGIFAIIYCSISFPNHYLFRTAALDLGMFNHALYNFAHLDANYFTLSSKGYSINYFGDHFSPITLLYAPFYYLLGSYTLLIIQILSILFGAVGIYRYASYKLPNIEHYKILIVVQFLSIWGIFSALSFDFHNNVVGAMFVPWLFLYYEKEKKLKFMLFFVLILITKENMSLWLVFIVLGLILKQRKFNIKELLKFEIPVLLLALVYFLIVVGFLMPWIRDGEGFNQLSRYSLLGKDLPEILQTILTKPGYAISLLFNNTTGFPRYDYIKAELHMMVLVSGGILFFLRPYYFLMLIPIYAQKMFSNRTGNWGINIQYSIEFAPIITLCIIDFFSSVKKSVYVTIGLIVFCISTMYFTYSTLESRKSRWYKKTESVFHRKIHYSSSLDIENIYQQINKIPQDAVVSCSSGLAPHLALRDEIYLFPKVANAEYIALLKIKNTWPIKNEKYYELIEELRNDKSYIVWYESKDLIIFKLGNSPDEIL